MPRTAPTNTEEMRISFSNKERQFISEQIKINNNKSWLGPLIGNIGTVTIGAGVVIGGYALWKWVGGFSPLDTLKDTVQGWVLAVSGGAYKTITGESPEETATRWVSEMQTKIEEIERYCRARRHTPESILASPNTTEQQKGQAERELAQINKTCAERIQRERDEVLDRLKMMDSMARASNPLYGLPLIGGWIRIVNES